MLRLRHTALAALLAAFPCAAPAQQTPPTPTSPAPPPARQESIPRPAPARPAAPTPTATGTTSAPAVPPARPVPATAPPAAAPAPATPVAPAAERWAAISPALANRRPARLPLGRGREGAEVLHVQVLLDRALFSPGVMDGRWGRNTEQALRFFQEREGLPATAQVDVATLARLSRAAGSPAEVVRRHVLAEADVRGPFVEIPEDIYEHAKLTCSCYESLSEKLGEVFHTTPAVLRLLNPGVTLDSLRAGDPLHVPAARDPAARAPGRIRELVVSGPGRYLQALDSAGRVLYHFPTTLGSTFDPSPSGEFVVRSITENPWWHYQPRLLAHVPDDRPSAHVPPGPNNAVGRVWVALSVPHFGIHGTRSPETIGYATSAGCVRLTNWDALFLARLLTPGIPVRFRDTRPPGAPDVARPPTAPSAPRADTAARPAPPLLGRPAAPPPARRDTAPRPASP